MASPEDESALCVACGLCCQGPLYTWARLEPDEVKLAEELALRVLPPDGETGFALPCSCLDGTRCSVYERRPRICGDFACSLLLKLRAGKIDLEAAQALVREARELLQEIEACLPQDRVTRVWDRIFERWDLRDLPRLLAEEDIEPATLMAIVGLDVHLHNHFRLPNDPPRLAGQ